MQGAFRALVFVSHKAVGKEKPGRTRASNSLEEE